MLTDVETSTPDCSSVAVDSQPCDSVQLISLMWLQQVQNLLNKPGDVLVYKPNGIAENDGPPNSILMTIDAPDVVQ